MRDAAKFSENLRQTRKEFFIPVFDANPSDLGSKELTIQPIGFAQEFPVASTMPKIGRRMGRSATDNPPFTMAANAGAFRLGRSDIRLQAGAGWLLPYPFFKG